ncbi:MAG TPA: M20/M25/M40 family metallo-hydrolase [Gemmatimonadaceae bacterium]|nr:M20/M25/M40 family metallo-hydrolase [Gemmatimonadaceae bacterium]
MHTTHCRRFALALLALALPLSRAAAQLPAQPQSPALTAGERAVARAVDAHNAQALALLERIVNINSGTLNFAGVRQVGDVLRAQLDSLGFATRWVDGAAFRRAGHLVAEHPGPGPRLLLIGHLDTVFEPSSPFQRFERLDDSTARGPGIIDMKGGDVIIIYALRALKDAGLLDRMNVVVVYNGDEEDSGEPLAEARRALMDAARGAAAAVGFEDGPGDPKLAVIARRGAESWTLRTTGTPAHSSQIFTPAVGAGAVYEAARILDEFYRRLAGEQYLTFNPGLALGGTAAEADTAGTSGTASGKRNVVAERMVVTGDLRTISPEQLARARRTMREIVARHRPRTSAEIAFDAGYPPMAPTAGNRRLLAMYDRASRELGFGPVAPVDPSRAGAADIAFVAALVPMKLDGVGLSGRDDHTEKETADLRMLPVLTKRAAVLLHRLSAQAATAPTP